MSNNSVYTVTCDSTGKVVYPSNFTEANKISSGGDSNLEFYHDGIHSGGEGWNTDGSGAILRSYGDNLFTIDPTVAEFNVPLSVASITNGHITSDTMSVKSNIDLNYYRAADEAPSTLKAKGWYVGYLQPSIIRTPSTVTIDKGGKDPDTGQELKTKTTITYVDLTLGTVQRKSEDLAKKETVGTRYHLDIADLPIRVGDVFLLINDTHIPNALVVVKKSDPGDGTITCRWLPNYDFKINPDTDDTFWNYSVYICGEVNVNTAGKIEDLTVTNNSDRATLGVVDLTPVAFNIGANNFIGGYAGVTVGDNNEVYDAYSMTVGAGNQIVGYGNFTSGRNSNIINGEYSIACGHSTSVNGSGRIQKLLKPGKTGANGDSDYDIFTSGTGCAVFGRICSSNNDYGTLISGIRNTSYSSLCSAIFGRMNKNNGHYSIIAGTNNEIKTGESNAVFGNNNIITGPRCFALGQGLKGYPYQTIIGKYNEENADSNKVFIIGQGTSGSKRKNILTVDKAGNLEAAGTGTFNNIDIKGSVNSDIKLNFNSTLKCAGDGEGTIDWVVGNEFDKECGLYFYGGTEPYSEYTKSYIFIQDGSGKTIRITPEAITFEDADVEDKDDTYIKKSITIDMNSWNDILNRITALEALHPKS